MKDFFISYNKADRAWAEWIAWQLEEAGYSVNIQAWDFRPGSNFVLDMHRAVRESERIIAVLSPDYLTSHFTASEWAAAFARDPSGEQGLLLPVRVRDCELQGLLPQIVYIDLLNADESKAKDILLAGIKRKTVKPPHSPKFPFIRTISEPSSFPGSPTYWHVPYNRNPHFTGREAALDDLAAMLKQGETNTLTQAITGLGGIGKTQLALEYAFRHASDYAGVWWFRMEETSTALIKDFSELAYRLDLPERDEKDPRMVIEAVRHWLGRERQRWLLIYDNASSPQKLAPYLPQTGYHHILITSRSPNWLGVAEPFRLVLLARTDSVKFLLKRTRAIDNISAEVLAKTLGDLPLALEQAGAYIEETRCRLADYLTLYETRGDELRRQRGEMATEYPDSVATTWNISFNSIEKMNPSAAELMRFCAFVYDNDAIPEQLITEGASELGPILAPVAADQLKLNEAIGDTLKYSLLHRNSETQTLEMHRLVQDVLKDSMDEATRQLWVERADRAWNLVFGRYPPQPPHSEGIDELINEWGKKYPKAAQIYNQDAALRMQTKANLRKLVKLYGIVSCTYEAIIEAIAAPEKTSREGLFLQLCHDMVEFGPCFMAWIGLIDEKTQIITCFCQYPQESSYLANIRANINKMPKNKDPTVTAIRQERVAYVNEYILNEQPLSWLDETLRSRVRSGAALPIRLGGKVIGAVTLYTNEPTLFDSDLQGFLEATSTDLSSALDSFERQRHVCREQTTLYKMLKKLRSEIQRVAFPGRGRDRHTKIHQRCMSQLAIAIARKAGLDDRQIDGICFGGLIHDIGNIAIPAEILCKSGQLTPTEVKIVCSHVQEGYDIIKGINFPWPMDQMILQHHERLDGSGYPKHLKGDDIIPEAKILAVADRIEASLSPRSNRPPLAINEALEKIKKSRGIHYDSNAIDACLSLFHNNRLPRFYRSCSVHDTQGDEKH
jgi:response regulator RpfG family c-di-GMP phosphodiesterase